MSRRGTLLGWIILGLSVLLIVACGGGGTPDDGTATPSQSTTPLEELTSSQVFSTVSPSVAFISTPIASGSAILLGDGYLLTNSHVVHGFEQARVVFPDGSEFLEVPVKSSDDLVDLAVLGPIDTDIDPLELKDREDLAIGSDVFLVGYPAETEEFPQPTITRGILSRLREWEAISMTYFQTDAAVTGGQSGGALVSARGEIIGLSGLRFSDADFGLVASAADVAPLAEALIQGNDASMLGSRPFTKADGLREHQVSLENPWDIRTFLIDVPVGSNVELKLEGVADGLFTVLDPFGALVALGDSGTTGVESDSFRVETEGRHSVAVGLSNGARGDFTLSGNVDLIPTNDPDDGVSLSIGKSVAGNIDFIGDLDYFFLTLTKGEPVEIRVESMNIDTELTVDFPRSRPDQVLTDHDDGGGLFGTDSVIDYGPIHSGDHFVVINDAVLSNTGGYLVSVNPVPADAASVETPLGSETVDSPFGTMTVFRSVSSGFSAQAPADWKEVATSLPGTELSLADDFDNNIVIVIEDLDAVGLADSTLDEYADLVVSLFTGQIPGFELLSQEHVQTAQGLDAVRLEYLALGGGFRGSRLIALDQNKKVINISVHTTLNQRLVLEDTIDYIFDSLRSE